jgi:hypothetical protein
MGRKTNKQRRATNAATAREKAAAARAEQQRAEQRRRAMAILSTVVTIAVIAAVIAVIAIKHKGSSGPATVASPSVVQPVTSVPAAVTDSIGAGDTLQTGVPMTVQGTSLATGGKPTLLYIGAEFCPYCAAQRWSIIEALSRFGTVSGLQQIKSSEDNISTFTFTHLKYTSKYLNFDGKEEADQNRNPLQKLTSTESAQWNKYLAPGQSSPGYPFMDLNGQYLFTSPMIDPTVVIGKTWTQIGAALKDPSSPIAKAINGAANYIASAICRTTNNKPASVCTAKIQSLTANLKPYPAT